jgi:hypothetical protein
MRYNGNMNDTTTKGYTMEMVSVPLALLKEMAQDNHAKSARYTELGLVEMAEWSEGRARAYEFLIENFSVAPQTLV